MRDYLKRIAAVIFAVTLLFSSVSFGEGENVATPTDLMPAEETPADETPAEGDPVPEEEEGEEEPIPADRTVTLETDQTLTGELDGDTGEPCRIRISGERGSSWALILTVGRKPKSRASASESAYVITTSPGCIPTSSRCPSKS